MALDALAHGRWGRACSLAAQVLAQGTRDLEALGVVGLCAAVMNDREIANAAIARLRESESPPGYFGRLTQGILDMLDRAPDKALLHFRAVQQARPNDPLALYFEGEALFAQQHREAAIAAFQTTLRAWPDFAPALTAAAQVLAGPQASQKDLLNAVQWVERATRAEPLNLGYWRLLAELCRRAGQGARAEAIELQYLRDLKPAVRTK